MFFPCDRAVWSIMIKTKQTRKMYVWRWIGKEWNTSRMWKWCEGESKQTEDCVAFSLCFSQLSMSASPYIPVLCYGKQQIRMWTHSWYWIFDNRIVQRGVHTQPEPELSLAVAFPATLASRPTMGRVMDWERDGPDALKQLYCWCLPDVFFLVYASSYYILGEVSLVTGRFCSHLVESNQINYICPLIKIFQTNIFFINWLCAPSKVFPLMMVVWTRNSCCVSEILGMCVFFFFFSLRGGVYLGHLVIRVKSIQRLQSTPLVCIAVVPTPPPA